MIFFDMDGTLANFYKDAECLEKMYEQGFFAHLEPHKALVKYVNDLASKQDNIYILSACVDTPYCKLEKMIWLHKHLPNISDDHIILIDANRSKIQAVVDTFGLDINEPYILVDDYSRNIYDWHTFCFNTIAVKWINGINNKTNKNYAMKAKTVKQLDKILKSCQELEEGE